MGEQLWGWQEKIFSCLYPPPSLHASEGQHHITLWLGMLLPM